MKKQTTKVIAASGACCTMRHKVLGLVALIALFICGYMVGILTHKTTNSVVVNDQIVEETQPVCAVIEKVLLNYVEPEDIGNPLYNLRNADVYSQLAVKGCPENTETFKALALRQIEIANALKSEEYMDEEDMKIVIDTYKKLDMEREAQAFLDKVQHLASPAIDFILQMEKVINEQ